MMVSTYRGGGDAGGMYGGSAGGYGAGAGGMYGGGAGGGYGAGDGGAHGGAACCGSNGCACGVAPGEECTACGVGCGGGGPGSGAMSYVGTGHGEYIQETTYKYIGAGGDFDVVRPRRDFTCIITSCCLLSLLLLLPLLLWLLSTLSTSSLPFDCDEGFVNWQSLWSAEQQDYCCMTTGRGCTTVPSTAFPETQPPTSPPTPPPTPPITRPPPPPGPVDPNCAVGAIPTWGAWKRDWCCQHHHVGCPPTAPPVT